MRARAKYFDSSGNEISAADAFDRNGVLKDRCSMRVPTQFRDAGIGSRGQRGSQPGDACTIDGRSGRLRNVNGDLVCVPLKSQDAKPQFTDGSNIVDPAAGLKPGWRMPVVQDRTNVRDAYAADAAYQRNRYKCGDGERLCDDCGGEGYDQDGNVCDTCHGKGVMPEVEDQREPGKSLFGSGNGHGRSDDSVSDSRSVKDQAYQSYNHDLQNAWRGR